MFAPGLQPLLVGVCLVGCVVRADGGDDFSNNLFSDLAPLLALFGERVTMQFMSQATSLADCVALAMAPLGILTAIVGAIRVGGLPWLMAIVGRARESRAVIEAELMSSTSTEVCELWNGNQIVRVMGQAPIREFIILTWEDEDDGATEMLEAAEIQTLSLGDKEEKKEADKYFEEYSPEHFSHTFQKLSEVRNHLRNRSRNVFSWKKCTFVDVEGGTSHHSGSTSNHGNHGRPASQSSRKSPRVVVLRNSPEYVPNLSFNIYNQTSSLRLYTVAIIGIFLQLSVLVYSGFATYHPALAFPKDDNPVSGYAYPFMAIGTLLLVLGMFICGYIIESSTLEKTYRPKKGWKARIVWLQKSGIVNDQKFESFAIFPRDERRSIITSRRADFLDPKSAKSDADTSSSPETTEADKVPSSSLGTTEKNIDPSKGAHTLSVAATLIGISGFIIQFVGLRGMHWSASVVQLGATIVMTILRTGLRLNLATLPLAYPVPSGHELDWLAMTLSGDLAKAPWRQATNTTKKEKAKANPQWSRHDRPWATDGGWDWGIETPTKHSPSPERDGVLESLSSPLVADPTANKALKMRRDAGKLAGWNGTASAEAIAVARAIEHSMTELSKLDLLPYCSFQECPWVVRICNRPISFRLHRKMGVWQAYSDEIDAALSLWLHAVDKQENETATRLGDVQTSTTSTGKTGDSDVWMRNKGTTARPSLQLLGPDNETLRQDLQWWIPDFGLKVIEVEGPIRSKHSDATTKSPTKGIGDGGIEVEPHRVVGSSEINGKALAITTYSPLRTIFAHYVFSGFMGEAARRMTAPIPDGAVVQPTNNTTGTDSTWKSFTLHNSNLLKLVQCIHSTGLGTLDEIYLALIPPLSAHHKLPRPDAIVDLAHKQAILDEQCDRWREAYDAYSWLVDTTERFPKTSTIPLRAAVMLAVFSCVVATATTLRRDQKLEYGALEKLKEMVEAKLEIAVKRCGVDDFSKDLWRLYDIQSSCLREAMTWPPKGTKRFLFDNMHNVGLEGGQLALSQNGRHLNEQDIIGWTPLHYAVASQYDPGPPYAFRKLLKSRSGITIQDIRGRKPLHYACRWGETKIVQELSGLDAEINARDVDGQSPLAIAAMNGHLDVVRLLLQTGADVNSADTLGNTALLWAAYKGHGEIVRCLWKVANREMRNHHGRTCFHLAVFSGKKDVVQFLLDEDADTEEPERQGCTPFHLAVECGHMNIIELLVEVADIDAEDNFGRTPLRIASNTGHYEVVASLLDKDANVNARDNTGNTPLHSASSEGHEEVVTLLLSKDAEVNAGDDGGSTPLHLASFRGHEKVVALLLSKDANVNARTRRANITPLSAASIKGHDKIVELLLGKGADFNANDTDGRRILHLASSRGHEKVVALLEKWTLRPEIAKLGYEGSKEAGV